MQRGRTTAPSRPIAFAVLAALLVLAGVWGLLFGIAYKSYPQESPVDQWYSFSGGQQVRYVHQTPDGYTLSPLRIGYISPADPHQLRGGASQHKVTVSLEHTEYVWLTKSPYMEKWQLYIGGSRPDDWDEESFRSKVFDSLLAEHPADQWTDFLSKRELLIQVYDAKEQRKIARAAMRRSAIDAAVQLAFGLVLLVLLMLIVARLSRSYRRVRKRLCPKCAYDMTGLPESKCPECGNVLSERQAARMLA